MAEIVHDNEKCLQVESDETVTEIPNVLNRQQIQHGCDPARDGNVLQAMSSQYLAFLCGVLWYMIETLCQQRERENGLAVYWSEMRPFNWMCGDKVMMKVERSWLDDAVGQ